MLAERAASSDVVRRLAAYRKDDAEAVDALLLDPGVSVLTETGHIGEALASLAFELALVGRLGPTARALPANVTFFSFARDLVVRTNSPVFLADGVAVIAGASQPLDSLSPGTFPDGTRVTRASMPLRGAIRFALFDPNPLAMDETHPEKAGNALDFGGVPADEWVASLDAAFGLLEAHLPGIAAEMQTMLRLVIPVGASRDRHLSASFREYVGALYLTHHPDVATMAEALVHEFQHNKLNLLSHHYPLLTNGFDFLYRSPVRPDPRPLIGILLAAHAFVPVAEFHRRLLASDDPRVDRGLVRRRLADVVAKNEEALRVLAAHAEHERAGELVFARLRAIHEGHRALGLELRDDVAHVA